MYKDRIGYVDICSISAYMVDALPSIYIRAFRTSQGLDEDGKTKTPSESVTPVEPAEEAATRRVATAVLWASRNASSFRLAKGVSRYQEMGWSLWKQVTRSHVGYRWLVAGTIPGGLSHWPACFWDGAANYQPGIVNQEVWNPTILAGFDFPDWIWHSKADKMKTTNSQIYSSKAVSIFIFMVELQAMIHVRTAPWRCVRSEHPLIMATASMLAPRSIRPLSVTINCCWGNTPLYTMEWSYLLQTLLVFDIHDQWVDPYWPFWVTSNDMDLELWWQ